MKLFVSYAHTDKPLCELVVKRLKKVHDVWYDKEGLYGGMEWESELEHQVRACEGFVYLLSPESIASKYCQQELESLAKLSTRQSKRADSTESHVPNILPSPFEWIYIPKGMTTLNYIGGYLQYEKNYSVRPFAISKYPITYSQFARFIDTGGYKNRQYWSKVVWSDEELWDSIIKTESIISKENAENPVSGLTWYEISGFCNWLSDVTGENITLPSEHQWQRAAQGDDKRKYTWGAKWDCQRCNCNVIPCQSEGITPITTYESLGISPFGVVDMVGNVWEYTSTLWNYERVDMKSTAPRVLRGGSWVNDGSRVINTLCRVSDDDDYDFSTEIRGFRLVKLDI